MKLLIIGSGGVGAPCASILARDDIVEEIRLADKNLEVAKKVSKKIGSKKITTFQADATNKDSIVALASGMDVLIDLVTPLYFLDILEAASLAKVHYVNTAWEETAYENYEAEGLYLNDRLKFNDSFIHNQKTAVLGCGMSSGYATNIIARYYLDRLDSVESIKFRLAKKDLSLSAEKELATAWNPGWNPRQAILDFVLPAVVFRDGKLIEIKEPFSEIEQWDFPEPFGTMPVSHHAHEEPFSIPHAFVGKGLKYCDFKYYFNRQVAPLVALGFGSEKEIIVEGKSIKPLDVLLALVPAPADAFLAENPEEFAYLDQTKHVVIMTEIIGIEQGRKVKYLITVPTMNAPRQTMYDLYGTSLISVALPAAIAAKMACEGTKKGVIQPHDLDPERFFALMKETGYPNRWQEEKVFL